MLLLPRFLLARGLTQVKIKNLVVGGRGLVLVLQATLFQLITRALQTKVCHCYCYSVHKFIYCIV